MAFSSAALASAVIGLGNLIELGSRSSIGRIRDLRLIRLLARVADSLDMNLLAALPRAAHRELDMATAAGASTLFAIAAAIAFLLLIPIALALAFAVRRNTSATVACAMSVFAVALTAASPLRPLLTVLAAVAIGALLFFLTRRGVASMRVVNSAALVAGALVLACTAAIPFEFQRARAARPLAPAGTPNIILISIDSLRADHLHAYGYRRATSPNLDRLASEGALFETAMAPTSWTLPSHMTLMTSLPPEKHGVVSNRKRLGAGIPTLAERLQHAGYYTGGVVSATYLDGMFGFSRGFDEYDDYTLLHPSGDVSAKEVSSPGVTELALSFLRRRATSTDGHPFFLFVHLFDVHYDYNPPEPFANMFDPAYEGPTTGEARAMAHIRKRRDLDHVIALYDGEIAFVDAHIGNLLQALSALRMQDNTIVAVVADHGEEFFEHGRSGHFKTLYDEVLHVPLLVRYPGHIPAGKRVQGQVRLMDVPPTLLELAGLRVRKPASNHDAMSLASELRSPSDNRVPCLPAFGDLNATLASLRTSREKLIWNLRTNQRVLYNLVADPGEQHAVAAAIDMNLLTTQLKQWRSSASELDQTERIEPGDEEKSRLQSLGYLE